MNEKKLISENRAILYARVLQPKDYMAVSITTDYSFTTIYNIINRRTPVNKKTQCVIDHLDNILESRIKEINNKFKNLEK